MPERSTAEKAEAPKAQTIEALRSAIDHSIEVVARADIDLAALIGAGLSPPASLTRHRSFHLMSLRNNIDLYYGSLNHVIETAAGKQMDDIGREDLR